MQDGPSYKILVRRRFGAEDTNEALPAMEYLLHHLETLKESVPKQKKRIRE
jgi:hypothetical protein